MLCEKCNRLPAKITHHIIPRCEGGSDGPTMQVCFPCHVAIHQNRVPGHNDWVTFGSRGGKTTASNPINWMRNLRQFKGWSDDRKLAYAAAKVLAFQKPEYAVYA